MTGLRRVLAGLACLGFLVQVAAGQETPAPGIRGYITPEGMRTFQRCRAAVFYHLDQAGRGDETVPVSFARVLREQIDFLMMQTLLRNIPDSIAESHARVQLIEEFYISFAETLRTERETMLDTARRERILFDCVPFVWAGLSSDINYLLSWRKKAIAAPPDPDPAAEVKWMEEKTRTLSASPGR